MKASATTRATSRGSVCCRGAAMEIKKAATIAPAAQPEVVNHGGQARSYGSGGRNQVHWAARLLTSTSHAIPSMV